MKKRRMKMLTLGLAAILLAGCGQKGQDAVGQTATESVQESTQENTAAIYLNRMDVTDLVELGTYKGIEVKGGSTEVTDDMVDGYLQYTFSMQRTLEEVTDRDIVEDSDVVNIDYEGKKDGVAFDGGTATGYNLEIGSGQFIQGFEEGLIGVKKGETVQLNLTFPETYHVKELAGAPVVFTVTVNQIQTYTEPELNDEYVASLGLEGVTTVEEYRSQIRETLSRQMQEEYKYQLQVSVIEAIMEGSKVQEPSEKLKQKYVQTAMNQTQKAAAYYGMDLETYVNNYYYVGLTEYEMEIEAGAYEAARQAMLCKKIADVEGIEVTDQELEEAATENYASFGFDSAESFKAANDMEEYRDSMLLNKVLDFLVENAVVIQDAGESEAATAETETVEAAETTTVEATAVETTEAE